LVNGVVPNAIKAFVDAAMTLGLGTRLADLTRDVQSSIDAYPDISDRRYLNRLELQRDRLVNPDLRLVVAILSELCADDPDRLRLLQPALFPLLSRHPYLARLLVQEDRGPTA
jgi:hypothetical protein